MYSKVGLYEHNIRSYEKIKRAFESGENIVGIVHATGTGKSYNALQLAYDNKEKKTLYIVPSNSIIEHIKQVINDNPNLDINEDFKNVEFRTYQSLINMSDSELQNLNYDYLIIDEFHHIGAPIWGDKIKKLINSHPNARVLGMTAYTVRDRGTQFERDMANPETDEIFSNKIVSRYDLCDAIVDGVLPKPLYKSAYINLMDFVYSVELKLETSILEPKDYQMYKNLIYDIKRRIQEAPSIEDLVRKNIKKDGKYIYFCPALSENGVNDIDTIMNEAKEWFKKYIPEADIVFYRTTSEDGKQGKLNRDAFYADKALDGESVDGKLRIMFAINQYNEGVHAPNIDGVIMGRATTSDIVFFEQLGRALSVRGDTEEKIQQYKKYASEELIEIARIKEIPISENMSNDEMIEKLVAPIVIDLTNNFAFMDELENKLKDRVKEVQEYKSDGHREIRIGKAKFDIEIENKDIFEMLTYLRERLAPRTWDDWYKLAKAYYEKTGNLDIKWTFKTFNGYEENKHGLNLGYWVTTQRVQYHKNMLSDEKIEKLKLIGMDFTKYKNRNGISWDDAYLLAKKYFEYHGNLDIKHDFRTKNGYEYDEDGYRLGNWILAQKQLQRNLRAELYYYYVKSPWEFNPWTESDRARSLKHINAIFGKFKKLFLIGFIGILEVNDRLNRKVCYEHNLNYDIYSELIIKIPNHELEAKINFLESNNIPLTENNKLNPTLYMNANQVKEIYGITYEELIDKYYVLDNPQKIV